MKGQWKPLSRHIALPFLVLALLLIASQLIQVHADRNQGIFYLKDHEGDRSVLADVTISGELRDGFHQTLFKLSGGNVTKETEVFDPPQSIRYDTSSPDKAKGNRQYEWNGFEPFSIAVRDWSDPGLYKTAFFAPGLVEYNDKHQVMHNSHSFTNVLPYGIAEVGDQLFAVVLSTNSYIGTSGIYKLNFTDGRNGAGEAPVSEALLTFSLDKNKEPGHSIEVLGLEAVGNKLVLILEEDKKLVIRSYDSGNGRLSGEIAVSHAVPQREIDTAYEAFTDEISHQLNIAMISGSNKTNDMVEKIIWSFDLSDDVKLLNEMNIRYNDSIEVDKRNMKSISYMNGKLYVVYKRLNLDGKTDNEKLFEPALPQELLIQVYEQSKLMYEGELVTDLNNDSIEAVNLNGAYSYDPSEHRAFDHIVIQSGQ